MSIAPCFGNTLVTALVLYYCINTGFVKFYMQVSGVGKIDMHRQLYGGLEGTQIYPYPPVAIFYVAKLSRENFSQVNIIIVINEKFAVAWKIEYNGFYKQKNCGETFIIG